MTEALYRQLLRFRPAPPECGAALGCDKAGIICEYCFDEGITDKERAVYKPNVSKLNDAIIIWQRMNIQFCGLAHTHPEKQITLSEADRLYIHKILKHNPHLSSPLFFPLIIPGKCIIGYRAVMQYGGIAITEEQITIKERREWKGSKK